jgi:GT2 family glycosyltransferase
VVDNASTDGSADLVETEFSWAKLIRSERNLGFGPAVNLGLQGAKTPWVAAANADIEVEPHALEELIAVGSADPEVAVVAPCLVLPSGEIQESVYAFPRLSTAIIAALGLPRLSARASTRARARWVPGGVSPSTVDWAVGAFLLIRTSTFNEIGGFDPDQWMYAEDLDLCWRAARAGKRTIYVPSAAIKHAGGASARMAFGDSAGTPEVLNAHYDWLLRRRGLVQLLAFASIAIFAAAARTILYLVLAVAVPRIRHNQLPRSLRWLALNARALRGLVARVDITEWRRR